MNGDSWDESPLPMMEPPKGGRIRALATAHQVQVPPRGRGTQGLHLPLGAWRSTKGVWEWE